MGTSLLFQQVTSSTGAESLYLCGPTHWSYCFFYWFSGSWDTFRSGGDETQSEANISQKEKKLITKAHLFCQSDVTRVVLLSIFFSFIWVNSKTTVWRFILCRKGSYYGSCYHTMRVPLLRHSYKTAHKKAMFIHILNS